MKYPMNWNKPITDEDWNLIDRYLDDELENSERAEFETRLEQDADWREAVASVRAIRIGIQEAALAQKLPEFHQELTAVEEEVPMLSKTSGRTWVRWAAAAAILLIASLGWWFWSGGQKSDNEKIYADFYQPDPGLPTVMGPAEDFEFQQGMVDYKAGNYSVAIAAWEKLLTRFPNSDTLTYFLASAWQADKEFDKAIPLFEKVAGQASSRLATDAAWYLGLLYLHKGEHDKAQAWIQKSVHPGRELLLEKINSSRQ